MGDIIQRGSEGSQGAGTDLSRIPEYAFCNAFAVGPGIQPWLSLTYVVGSTASSNFPTTGAYQASLSGGIDGFVTRINSGGTTAGFSTFLGSTGTDSCRVVAVDSEGYVLVAGTTASTGFPTVLPRQGTYGGGISDAFLGMAA